MAHPAASPRTGDPHPGEPLYGDSSFPRPGPPPPGASWTGLADRVEMWRQDWRVGAVALAIVALVAGLLWYRAGSGATLSGATGGSTTAGADTGATTSPVTGSGGDAAAGAGSATETGAGGSADGGAGGASAAPAPAPPPLVVHVAGAVAVPGVYELPAGARVRDAVSAAGGPVAGADLDRLNLATPLADGQRVEVPAVDDPPDVGGVSGGVPAAGTDPPGVAPPVAAGPVDLNTATVGQLDALPGVGPSIAAAIVTYREEHGGFGSVEELVEVRGIGEARLAELRPLVTV